MYMDECGLMQVAKGDDKMQSRSGSSNGKEKVYISKKSLAEKKAAIVNESKKESSESQILPDLLTCQGCGCHGTDSEFETPISCSSTCSAYIATMKQKHHNEEKEK